MTNNHRFAFGFQKDQPDSREELVQLHRLPGHERSQSQTYEQPKSRPHSSSSRNVFNKFWLREISSILLATGCLLAIIILLRVFDGQPIPKWRYGITLNAIVSIIATVLVFSLTMPVSAGLAQLKWIRLRTERQLVEFERIENAARGPSGALMLLVRGKGGLLGYFGAGLIVSMLAIGPFVQQIVNTTIHTIESPDASLPIAYDYIIPSDTGRIIHTDVDLNMKSAIMAGLLSTSNGANQFAVPITCSTSNCTWPDYRSLAVCSSCANLTDQLTTTSPSNKTSLVDVTYHLASGTHLHYTGDPGFQMTIDSYKASMAFKNHNETMLDFFVIALGNNTLYDRDSKPRGPYAAECILEFCVQNFTAKVNNGTYVETRQGKGSRLNDYAASSINETRDETHPDNRTYKVEWNSMKSFQAYLPSLFKGRVKNPDTPSPVPLWNNDVAQALWYHLNQEPHTLDSMFTNIENAMTRAVRIHPSTTERVQGQSLIQQTLVQVDWPWIALPAALLLFVVVFLTVVSILTKLSGLEPWKESSLAVLFHGLGPEDKTTTVSRLRRQDQMIEAAKGIYVRLRSDGGGPVMERTRSDT